VRRYLPNPSMHRAPLRGEDGVTLVEVIVSMLLVGLIALSFSGLDAAGRTTADQRRVAIATQIAQEDQERLRGLSADQLATLDESRDVTIDLTTYTVTSKGTYTSASGGADSCASTTAAADFARVVTEVDWTANRRSPVKLQSLITPRVGGSLVVQGIDQGGAALPGVTVTATGTDEDTQGVVRSGTTDDGGCVIFGSLPVGSYSVAAALSGYIDEKSVAAPTQSVTTTAGNSLNLTFKLGRPGQISTAAFSTVVYSGTPAVPTTVPAQQAPGMSWNNAGMLTPGVTSSSAFATTFSTPTASLFPFTAGTPTTFTDNYQVWAGRCTAAQPPTAAGAGRTFVTVSPGLTGVPNPPTVKMPLMRVVVTYSSANVKPGTMKFTDPCGTARTFTSGSGLVTTTTFPSTTGWLQYPGQLYGTHTSLCVDYDPPGSVTTRKSTITSFANTSFTANNTVTFPNMTSSSAAGPC
jgi:Tfp pilus assembly protein PilV